MELLRTERLGKQFGQHKALSDITFEIRPGEVHALVGENGAGKSTFIKMVTGVYSIDEGKLFWEDKPVVIQTPQDAVNLGISVIHQDRQLIPSFKGYENLFLGKAYPANGLSRSVKWSQMKETGETLKKRLGIDLDLNKTAQEMSPPEKTMLEILRAMMQDCKLLILDEPTASLTDREAELLFELIGRLIKQGTSILYVSHRMEEIFRLSHRITVFRNGRYIGTVAKEEATHESLVQMMTDQDAPERTSRPVKKMDGANKLLSVSGLATADGKVKQASFDVHAGEVLGIFGLAGAGRTELLEAVYGLRKIVAGTVAGANNEAVRPAPKTSLQRGIVLIPEDRRSHAMIGSMTIRENMTLPVIKRFATWLKIKHRQEKQTVKQYMESLQVKATGMEQEIGQLSGGNQQKVVFAKALLSDPKVFLCDEPTQAVDVMTREEIHRLLQRKASEGCGVVFVSSDLQEVLDIADRIVVMHEGKTIAELPNEGVTPEQVLQICYRHGEKGA